MGVKHSLYRTLIYPSWRGKQVSELKVGIGVETDKTKLTFPEFNDFIPAVEIYIIIINYNYE